jgi:hypothetical protein
MDEIKTDSTDTFDEELIKAISSNDTIKITNLLVKYKDSVHVGILENIKKLKEIAHEAENPNIR